ncbi:VIT and VWA domain-containing protein [Roseibium sp. FZY0029]|uniref:VIT and vWA domain-containing protein n=1 Tax=Roseibium sp. FZY0029 TaxID=3116647 RepID=UPI002EB5B549|nr:VIT and VWA domain-containing protein [Roseibium sp. FZY0029]
MTFLSKYVSVSSLAASLATVFSTLSVLPAAAEPDLDDLSGTVVATSGGKEIHLPLLKADYRVEVDGDVAHVELTQTFLNPTKLPLNATYLFPLNQKAAIHAMRMDLDGETIVARIKKKDEAKATFEKAKREGKAAALLTQHRPNMFTQDIAHLMPGRPVKVTLEYAQTVPKIDGAYELVMPMVVGPRYEGPGPQAAMEASQIIAGDHRTEDDGPGYGDTAYASDESISAKPAAFKHSETGSGWQIDKLPAYPQVIGQNAPKEIDPRRVSLELALKAPMPVWRLSSETHALEVSSQGDMQTVRFKSGRAIDNRDFVLRYELAAQSDVAAGASSRYEADGGGYFSLLIEPPKLPTEDMIGQRELVFVLDTSGSMTGQPMEASKTFMSAAIKALRPDDYFRILRFSNNTSQFAGDAVLATERNKRQALKFVSSLEAGGGTEIDRAVNTAFDQAQPDNTTRIVVFLTDGYIGDEATVISSVANRIGKARIYAFGVGNSVNRFLLDAMASEGRGYARYVALGEDAGDAAESLAANLKTPLLTDISIDWNGLKVEGQSPARIPDLFEGGSVRVMGRYTVGGRHTIFVNGLVNGHAARLPLEIDLKSTVDGNAVSSRALPLIWAREQIFDKERVYTIGGSTDTQLKQEIVDLGLTYSLQTRFTSFVAVSEKVVNGAPGATSHRNVPLPQVAGVSTNAYPSLNLSGSSAPEPEGIFGLMLVLLAVAARFRLQLANSFRRLRDRVRGFRPRGEEATPGELDLALPRTLRRDGWWLET